MENFNAISWINTLPSGWKAVKLKYLLEQGKGSMKVGPFGSQLSGKDFTDEGYWVYNQKVVVNQDFDETDAFISEDKYNSMEGFQVETGDILITTRGTIGRICRVPKVYHPGIIHPCIIKFRIDEEKVLYNLVRLLFNESNMIKDQLDFMSNATTIDVVYSEPLKNVYIPIAPLNVQCKLTSYLQDKCSDIDTMTADIQSEIDMLEKYKRSVITEAVTKGLDKDVEMKDSGIEWIGKIPYTWNVGKIKFYVDKVGSGKTPKGDEKLYTQGEIFFLRSQNIFDTGIVLDEEPTVITDAIDAEMANTRVLFDDVLLNITGGSIGRCCIYKFKNRANVNQHVCIIRTKKDKILPAYMHYFWISNLGQTAINLYQTGGNREGMSADAIKNTPIPIMSIQEQKDIVQYLDDKCSNIDIAVSQKQEQLNILNDYKKSLIYEYVTGKKEVPSSWQN